MPYMYMLECADGSYYTGSTWSLEKRVEQHQRGIGANHTAKRLPVKLVYYEEFARIADAYEREKQVQGWSRKKKQALIAGNTNQLHRLAECQNESHFSRFRYSSSTDSLRSLSEAEGSENQRKENKSKNEPQSGPKE